MSDASRAAADAAGRRESPEGVRLVAPDGTEYPCDVIRDDDHDGLAVWFAVPREPLEAPASGVWTLKADMLPAFTELRVAVPAAAGGEDGS